MSLAPVRVLTCALRVCTGRCSGAHTNAECFVKADGSDYRGSVIRTKSGRYCLLWSEEAKADGTKRYWTGRDGAAAKGVGNHNYCRNPTGHTGAWCYTTTMFGKDTWEDCEVGDAVASCTGEAAPCLELIANSVTHTV